MEIFIIFLNIYHLIRDCEIIKVQVQLRMKKKLNDNNISRAKFNLPTDVP